MKSWRTTVAGWLVLLAVAFKVLAEAFPLIAQGKVFEALAVIQSQWDSIMTALSGIGVALLFAADHKTVTNANGQ